MDRLKTFIFGGKRSKSMVKIMSFHLQGVSKVFAFTVRKYENIELAFFIRVSYTMYVVVMLHFGIL